MIGDLGAPELLIIFAVVILLFGVGKVGRLGKDLGTAVREFRTAVRDDSDDEPSSSPSPGLSATAQLEMPPAPPTEHPRPPAIF